MTLFKVKQYFSIVPGCSSSAGRAEAVAGESEAAGDTTEPHAPSRSSRVLTDAVLQVQRDTVSAVDHVATELREIKTILKDISETLKELVNKKIKKSISLYLLCAFL